MRGSGASQVPVHRRGKQSDAAILDGPGNLWSSRGKQSDAAILDGPGNLWSSSGLDWPTHTPFFVRFTKTFYQESGESILSE
jgi:hypothetical protein